MISFDGQTYEKEEDVPDLGSLRCVKTDGNRRFYKGLVADSYKLPKYNNLGTGSMFFAVDSNVIREYESTTKTWYLKNNSGGDIPEEDYADVVGELESFTKQDWDKFFDENEIGDNDEFGGNIEFDDFFENGGGN